MATYKKSAETKDAILRAAKELFYEKGYIDTYIKDIAERAGVNAGLIHYHYTSKAALALEIYMSYLTDHLTKVAEMFPEESTLVHNAVSIRYLWKMMEENPELLRFMHEINSERIPLMMSSTDIGQDYMRELNANTRWENKDMMELICRCATATEMELIDSYAKGPEGFSREELSEMDIRMTLQIACVANSIIVDVLQRSAECAARIRMQTLPAFTLRVDQGPVLPDQSGSDDRFQ